MAIISVGVFPDIESPAAFPIAARFTNGILLVRLALVGLKGGAVRAIHGQNCAMEYMPSRDRLPKFPGPSGDFIPAIGTLMGGINVVLRIETIDSTTLGALRGFRDGEQDGSIYTVSRRLTQILRRDCGDSTYCCPPSVVEAYGNSSGDTYAPPGVLTPAKVGFLKGPVPFPPGKVFFTPASFRLSLLSEPSR